MEAVQKFGTELIPKNANNITKAQLTNGITH